MKILTVVGARPQFIKAAAMSRILRREHQEILVHTGQHFDENMSGIFFDELDIPRPDYNLGISGGTHGQMTGRMLMAVEDVLLKERPDAVLLYGDTNSTLAAALAAVKLQIPVIHVESGNRFGSLGSPEEVNRICTDHVSGLRFACVQSALESLEKENLGKGSYLVGDPMYDAFLHYRGRKELKDFELKDIVGDSTLSVPQKYYYLTCHREENTKDSVVLCGILDAMECLDALVVYPVHPRNRGKVLELQREHGYENILFVDPVGYLESIALVSSAEKVVTDSGGVQREAFFARKKCVTVLDYVVWPETMDGNANELAKPDAKEILEKLERRPEWHPGYEPFGDGHACEKMCRYIQMFGENL